MLFLTPTDPVPAKICISASFVLFSTVFSARLFRVQIPLRLSLRQLYMGDTFDTVYIRQAVCVAAAQCEKKCKECAGPGTAVRMQQIAPGYVQQLQVGSKP